MSRSAHVVPRVLVASAVMIGVVALLPLPAEAAVSNLGFTGGEQTYVVPDGVYSLNVVANGASGGNLTSTATLGGAGATVTGSIDVVPNETVYVEVGGKGADGNVTDGTHPPPPHLGGFNGGGTTSPGNGGADGLGGGAGGGATDIRTCSISDGGCDSLGSRLLVAGGGGGAGDVGTNGTSVVAGTSGGAAGSPGTGGTATGGEPGGNPGTAGTTGGPGSGGAMVTASNAYLNKIDGAPGGDGSLGQGGTTPPLDNGGGGGGGYYGGGAGGGGASNVIDQRGSGGSGGGGSSIGGTVSAGPSSSNGSISITPVHAPAPTVAITSLTAASSSAVSVHGTVNANSFEVTACVVAYGTTPSLGSKVSCTPAAGSITGNAPTQVSASLTKLKPGTKYFVAIAAVGAGGTGVSVKKTVTTKAARPKLGKPKAKSVKATTAKFTVAVKPQGAKTVGRFVFGPTKNYGKQTKAIKVAAGKNAKATAKLKGLTAGTKYHARAMATNRAGTTKSKDITFKTKP